MAAPPQEELPPQEDMDDLIGKPTPKKEPGKRQRIEYYAEEQFLGANLRRSVHVGWGACIGAAIIMFCMGMSAVTQSKSWNVGFLWLQRRVGAQFGTMSYMITSNSMYYHDGDTWVTRDWANLSRRWQAFNSAAARGPPLRGAEGGVARGFAADGLRER